jgi:phospho-N-acetylmuramoyl-pentapeptide-transferase
MATKFIIPKLKSMKVGQKILDIGPRWHKSKENTPTMGGIVFLFTFTIVCSVLLLIAYKENVIESLLGAVFTILFALANGVVGIVDDLTKLKKKQNAGLSVKQKLVLQIAFSAAYIALMRIYGLLSTSLYIPYADVSIELGFAYYFFAIIVCLATVNCVNLTDGIDGLASSVTMIVGAFFAVAAFKYDMTSLVIISGGISGVTLGFLVYNFYPARIFMGDTGSLFLGGLVCGCAFMINNPLIILLIGAIYALEGLSVVLQVSSYKLRHGKRIFKMAPIHHHFEQCGWSEIKIVSIASIATLALCAVAYFGL